MIIVSQRAQCAQCTRISRVVSISEYTQGMKTIIRVWKNVRLVMHKSKRLDWSTEGKKRPPHWRTEAVTFITTVALYVMENAVPVIYFMGATASINNLRNHSVTQEHVVNGAYVFAPIKIFFCMYSKLQPLLRLGWKLWLAQRKQRHSI